MAYDNRGIYRYTETDDAVTHSALLNLGMASVSEAMTYFSGTSAERMALVPAPPGALWKDTDGTRGLYSVSPDGSWRAQAGRVSSPAVAWTTTSPVWARSLDVDLPVALSADETIQISPEDTGGFYGGVSLAGVQRHATKTSLLVRFFSFNAATRALAFTWSIVSVGASNA